MGGEGAAVRKFQSKNQEGCVKDSFMPDADTGIGMHP